MWPLHLFDCRLNLTVYSVVSVGHVNCSAKCKVTCNLTGGIVTPNLFASTQKKRKESISRFAKAKKIGY